MAIPFIHEMNITHGVCDRLSPLVRRVVAPNPSPFTFMGTNTYIIGAGSKLAVIDPGPYLTEHVDCLCDVLGEAAVSHILVTHTHNDHSPAAALLKERTGAETYAYAPHGSGRVQADLPQLEEGGDRNFQPDHLIRHGDRLAGEDFEIECVFTPGHTSNHMCFALREEQALFTGDHIMSWATSVIVPPDGHMGSYMDSLNLLLERDDQILYPAHGEAIPNPQSFIRAFIIHRKQREASIKACLENGIGDIRKMVTHLYKTTDKRLHPAAAMSVLAHLQHMAEKNIVRSQGSSLDSVWHLA